MNRIRAGMRVQVWQKPYTREEKEGVATLVRPDPVGIPRDGYDRWYVRFDGEDRPVSRIVSERDAVMED